MFQVWYNSYNIKRWKKFYLNVFYFYILQGVLSMSSLFPIKLGYLVKTTYRTHKNKTTATLYFTLTRESVEEINKRNAESAMAEPIFKAVLDINNLSNMLAGFGPVASNLFERGDIPYVDLVNGLPFEYRCLKHISTSRLACFIMINPSTYEVVQTFSAPTQSAVDLLTALSDIVAGNGSFYDNSNRIRHILYTLGGTTSDVESLTTYVNLIDKMLVKLEHVDFSDLDDELLTEKLN